MVRCREKCSTTRATGTVAPNPVAFNVIFQPATPANSAVLSAGGSSFSTTLPAGVCFVVTAQSPSGGDFRYAAEWNQPSEAVSGESNDPTATNPLTAQSDFFRSCSADGDPFTIDLSAGPGTVVDVSINNLLASPPILHQGTVTGGSSWTSPSLPAGSCWAVHVVSNQTTNAPVFTYDANW